MNQDNVDRVADIILRAIEEKYGDERPVVIANMLCRIVDQRVKRGDFNAEQRAQLREHVLTLLRQLETSEGTGGLSTRQIIARWRLRKQLH